MEPWGLMMYPVEGKSRRSLGVAAILAILVCALGTLLLVKDLAGLLHFDLRTAESALSPNAGLEQSVPSIVADAKRVVNAGGSGQSRYRLDGRLARDPLVQQRMWEVLYPVRFSDDPKLPVISEYPISRKNNCNIESRGVQVAIVECR